MKDRGDYVETANGVAFHFFDVQMEDILLEDIAEALSKQCRYNGHCKGWFYSVAEHAVLASYFIETDDPLLKLTALHHDDSEAYISDIPRPLKPHLNAYKEFELAIEKRIAEKFKFVFPYPPEVKKIDNIMLASEKELFFPFSKHEWILPEPENPQIINRIRGYNWQEAKRRFLWRHEELCQELGMEVDYYNEA